MKSDNTHFRFLHFQNYGRNLDFGNARRNYLFKIIKKLADQFFKSTRPMEPSGVHKQHCVNRANLLSQISRSLHFQNSAHNEILKSCGAFFENVRCQITDFTGVMAGFHVVRVIVATVLNNIPRKKNNLSDEI